MNPDVLEKLIDKGRDGYEARLAAGQARMASGDLEKAVEHLEAATRFEPSYTAAWQALGQAYSALDRPQDARTAWQSGEAAARANGDKQSEKVLGVWLKRLDRQAD